MSLLLPMSDVAYSLAAAARLDAATMRRPPQPLPPVLRAPATLSSSLDAGGFVPLPAPGASRMPLAEVLAARRSLRHFSAGPVPLAPVAAALLGAGDADATWSPEEREAGLGLDFFVLADRIEGVPRGVYHLDPASRRLWRTPAALPGLQELVLQLELAATPALLVAAASPLAAETRHGVHGYRLLLARASSTLYTGWLAAIAAGAGGCLFAGLLAPARHLVGTDGFDRVPLCALSIGLPIHSDLPSAATAADKSNQQTGNAGRDGGTPQPDR